MGRRSLKISIDEPYNPQTEHYSVSSSSSPESARTSTVTGSDDDGSDTTILQSVLCMYDFHSNDPGLLGFHRNEILDIVRREETGWWAAMRAGGDVIGWIPQAFVRPLTEEMTDRLRNVREELRVYEYEAEQLYNSAPVSLSLPLDDTDSSTTDSFPYEYKRRPCPPSPVTPMPKPPSISAPITSSNPPTDRLLTVAPLRYRSESAPTVCKGNQRPPFNEFRHDSGRSNKRKGDKVTQTIENARAFDDALPTQTSPPWFLLPRYADQLQLDSEGQVRSGTIAALLEKLTLNTLTKDLTRANRDTMSQDAIFRDVFLTTFRTFISADEFFDKLVEIYRMEYPAADSNDSEFDEWKERLLLPTQRLVLTIFTIWLQDHRLLEEEPHIAQRLTNFLTEITIATPPLAQKAQLILQSIERLTFEVPSSIPQPAVPPGKRRKTRPHKGDLLRLDPADIAEQLALMEFKLYAKITRQECIRYARCQTGKEVSNLNAFCATHDKLVAWVQTTILFNEALGKRADTIDFWIKVAEKCRNLNNFASMSAIVNALSSVVLTRLHLTWAHVGKKSNLEALSKFNDPTGGFSGYRTLHSSNAEGPCVPFIGMYLTDIVHIKDQFSNEDDRISFIRCQRWYDAVTTMLKSQTKPYPIAENESTATFISGHLRSMGTSNRDQSRLWARSQEVQKTELQSSDIRRGLEAAGF